MQSDAWRGWETIRRLDSIQQVKVFYMPDGDPYYKHRYEERGDAFSLRSWSSADHETTTEGTLTGKNPRPQWLTNIINVAIVGGQLQRAPSGKHHAIVWFRTDAARTLIDFIDFTKGQL